MDSSRSNVQSSMPCSDENTGTSLSDSFHSCFSEHLSSSGISQNAHLANENTSKLPSECFTSSSSVPLNPQVQGLDEQPSYPDLEPYPPRVISYPDLTRATRSLIYPNPLHSLPPREFAHAAGLDHVVQPGLPVERLSSEGSGDANVPLSLALRQLELWDEVPPDFPEQVAVFLAQGTGQEAQGELGPENSINKEEALTKSKRAGSEEKEDDDKKEDEEVVTIELDLNSEVAAAIQILILQHSAEQELIASIRAPRALAEELRRRTVRSSDVGRLPSIESVLQGPRPRKQVFGVQLFRKVT